MCNNETIFNILVTLLGMINNKEQNDGICYLVEDKDLFDKVVHWWNMLTGGR